MFLLFFLSNPFSFPQKKLFFIFIFSQLNHNSLNGEFPTEIGLLTGLEYMYVFYIYVFSILYKYYIIIFFFSHFQFLSFLLFFYLNLFIDIFKTIDSGMLFLLNLDFFILFDTCFLFISFFLIILLVNLFFPLPLPPFSLSLVEKFINI